MRAALSLRDAELADVDAITAMMIRTFRETYSERHHGVCRDADVEAYVAEHFAPPIQRAELEDARMRTVLAECDRTLAGYAQMRLDAPPPVVLDARRSSEVARFYVDRPWHGHGVASALMRASLAHAADSDLVWLSVFERNDRAIAFYEKMGFVKSGRTTFVMGDDVQNDWVMVLRLAPS